MALPQLTDEQRKAALEKAAGYSTNLWACRRAAELLAGLEASASKEI